jgi:hypothetical protein
VFIFGSSVAFGIWDGVSDIDFTVVDIEAYSRGEWPPNEKSGVRSITQILMRAGFPANNLEMILFARVPILKHHASTHLFNIAPKEAEEIVSRTCRFFLAAPASDIDRLLLEGGVRHHLSPDAVQQVWWSRNGDMMSMTLKSTTEAMRALTSTPTVGENNRCVRVAPMHNEYRPELFRIEFDLSFRTFGIRNSQLLRQYLLSHPCARPGAIVLKEWSKTSGVNNSVNGFFTSYAVNIMWIYFLIQKNTVPYVDPVDIPGSLNAYRCDPEYVPIDSPNMDEQAKIQLYVQMGDLLLGFFRYYALEFDWAKNVVSLNRRETTTKESLGWDREELLPGRKNTRYELCIEDPYEENLNLGRHIGPTKARKVQAEFLRGFLSLIKDDVDESCVFEASDAGSAQEQEIPVEAVVKLMAKVVQCVESAPNSTISSKDLQAHLNEVARAELSIALKVMNWQQLIFRLGYKVMGGNVHPRRFIGTRKRAKPMSVSKEDSAEGATASDEGVNLTTNNEVDAQLTSTVLREAAKDSVFSPDWVMWCPPTEKHIPGYRRFDPTCGERPPVPTVPPPLSHESVTKCSSPAYGLMQLASRELRLDRCMAASPSVPPLRASTLVRSLARTLI